MGSAENGSPWERGGPLARGVHGLGGAESALRYTPGGIAPKFAVREGTFEHGWHWDTVFSADRYILPAMGFLDRFKKSDDQPKKVTITETLAEITGGQFVDGRVILPHSGVSVRADIAEVSPNGVATIHVWIDHPSWDRTFFESASGTGDTTDKAINSALYNVGIHVIHLVDHLPSELPDDTFTTSWAGQEHRWSMWCGYISSQGGSDSGDVSGTGAPYFHLLKDAIRDRLGNQKVAYVKVTAAWFNEVVAEVRLNNVVSQDLSSILRTHIQTTWPQQAMIFHKQLMWIVQDPKTYVPYPYTQADLQKHLITAGRVFYDMTHPDPGAYSQDAYEYHLSQEIGDPSLAMELSGMVPEMAARNVYSDWPVDESATIRSGDSEYPININQLACYSGLYEALDSTWCDEVPEEVIRGWVSTSALTNIIAQVTDKGGQASDMNPIRISYGFGAGYQLR